MTTTTASTLAKLILPIGQFVGTHYESASPADHKHHIRRHDTTLYLGDQPFAVWSTLHGVANQLDQRAWTRTAVRQALIGMQAGAEQSPPERLTPDGIERIINGLVANGLAADVVPEGAQAVRFAETHRIRSRMLGLGNHPDQTGVYSIGFFDAPIVTVSRILYELWGLSETYPTLWGACLSLARQEQQAGITDPELTDPGRMLAGFLGAAHRLLSVGAIYLEPAG